MSEQQGYELADAAYPLEPEAAAARVTVGEEIRCLLAAGWAWHGDRLVHPQDKDVWTSYRRVDSHKIRTAQFDAEIEHAVRKARRQVQGGE